MRNRSRNASLLLISHDVATLKEMHAFFLHAGARITCLSTLDQASKVGPGLDVAVIFAERMPVDVIAEAAITLQVNLVVIVSSIPESIRTELGSRVSQGRILILAAPVLRSTLLAAVRQGLPLGEA